MRGEEDEAPIADDDTDLAMEEFKATDEWQDVKEGWWKLN